MGSTRAVPLELTPDSQATEFVVQVTARDLHDARNGSEHVFTYAPDETEATLARAVRDWFAHGDASGLHLALTDRQTLFAFHWAAMQMPANSRCFREIDSDDCERSLAYWLARVRSGDPQFVSAYRSAEIRLKLPPGR
jgi:hypothetical protein